MLVVIVIVCNFVIVLFNLYLIHKIYKIKVLLSKISYVLTNLEVNCEVSLKELSLATLETGLKFNNLTQQYKLIKKYNQQLQKIVLILRLTYNLFLKDKLSKSM